MTVEAHGIKGMIEDDAAWVLIDGQGHRPNLGAIVEIGHRWINAPADDPSGVVDDLAAGIERLRALGEQARIQGAPAGGIDDLRNWERQAAIVLAATRKGAK